MIEIRESGAGAATAGSTTSTCSAGTATLTITGVSYSEANVGGSAGSTKSAASSMQVAAANETNASLRIIADAMNDSERIVLNVGGIKYETYRSTLTAYPDTLLGTMFAERNASMIHPVNGNEYFIDRNGHAFFYVLEFYRTGKILWRDQHAPGGYSTSHARRNSSVAFPSVRCPYPCACACACSSTTSPARPVTRQELEEEMHYFQLPLHALRSSFTHRAIAVRLDQFVSALLDVAYHLASEFESRVRIDFRRNKHAPHVKIIPVSLAVGSSLSPTGDLVTMGASESNVGSQLYHTITQAVRPFAGVGYAMLERFGADIGAYLQDTIPELCWDLNHVDNYNWYSLRLRIGAPMDELISNVRAMDMGSNAHDGWSARISRGLRTASARQHMREMEAIGYEEVLRNSCLSEYYNGARSTSGGTNSHSC